jgi:hypothetical protein
MEPNRVAILARETAGLFSHLFQVLGAIHQAQRTGEVPLVYFNRMFCYWNPGGYNGRTNAWEYYFEPLSPASLAEVLEVSDASLQTWSYADFLARRQHGIRFSWQYHQDAVGFGGWGQFTTEHRNRCADLIQRHVRLREELVDRWKRLKADLLGGAESVLGVHFRGTDKVHENSHSLDRPFIAAEGFFPAVDAQSEALGNPLIFLASDSAWAVRRFRRRYGRRLVEANHLRSLGRSGVHHTVGGPLVGEQVLLDALLLSGCRHLVHGMSNVSSAALAFNPSLTESNVYERKDKDQAN